MIRVIGRILSGTIGAIVVTAGVFALYHANEDKLSVNQAPAVFKAIERMEKTGVPDFELERLDGTRLKLSDYKGKIIIVNFWASWCNPCVEEFPSMVKLAQAMSNDVQIIAISTDDDKKDIATFAKLFNLLQKGFEIVWDKSQLVRKSYEVDKIPESFLVNRDMKLIRKVLGVEDWASPSALEYFKSLTSGATASSADGPVPAPSPVGSETSK